MSLMTSQKSSPSSTISSDYQSPITSKVLHKNTKNSIQKNSKIVQNPYPGYIFAQILLHILSENKKSKDYYNKINFNNDGHFTFKMRPSISLFDFLQRILKYIKIEFSTLIIAMIYIDRICKEKVFLNEYNIHRIMIIAIYIAYIYNEDVIFNCDYLSLVSGMNKNEILTLEEDFLDLIEFNLFVDNDEYEQYKQFILKEYIETKN